MEKIKFNPDNKKYYSKDFIKGFECGVERQFNADMEEKTAEWIPVSERLPERDVSVLAYHKNVSFDYQYISWIDEYSGEWAGFIGNSTDEVLAWMPLPEPYKVE